MHQAYKLVSLKHLLEKCTPDRILELGSGTTTAIFADYVRARRGVHLTSVDEDQHWLSNSRALAGVDADDVRFSFILSPKCQGSFGNRAAFCYQVNVPGIYDFVFVDGPSHRFNGTRIKDAVDIDVFHVLRRYHPQTIVVDGRYATAAALQEHLTASYQVLLSEFRDGPPIEAYNYFSLFQRIAESERLPPGPEAGHP